MVLYSKTAAAPWVCQHDVCQLDPQLKTYEASDEKWNSMIFDDWRHEGRLDYRHSDECPEKSPSCDEYIANLCPWSVSMPKEV